MAIFYPDFRYLDKGPKDFGLMVAAIDGNTNEEMDTFLSVEGVEDQNYMGITAVDYGMKFTSRAVFEIPLIKKDGTPFSPIEVSKCINWLTNTKSIECLYIFVNNYSDDMPETAHYKGRFTNIKQHISDGKTIGLILEFTATTPWGYSTLVSHDIELTRGEGKDLVVSNKFANKSLPSIYINATYVSGDSDGSLEITNATTNETTKVDNIAENETITISDNMFITSDKTVRIFGDDFNFVFPKLAQLDENQFTINGCGTLHIEYNLPMIIGNVTLNADGLLYECNQN